MKNLFLLFALFLVFSGTACENKSEPAKIELDVSLPTPESQNNKPGLLEEAGKKADQGIQKAGEKIDQGLKTTGEGIQKGLNQAGEKVKDATN